jgi:hypothetical protein
LRAGIEAGRGGENVGESRTRRRSRWRTAVAALLALTAQPSIAFDPGGYGRILEAHTQEVSDTAGVRVDYEALRGSSGWRSVVASLAASDPSALTTRSARLAFWINAYNVLAIDLVTRNWPVASIRDIGSFLRPVWKREAGRIGGRAYSLDEIEHGILRPLGEPRIHAAIVCASVSCPSLARTPYRATELDAQLDASLARWLADPRKGSRLDAGAGVLRLSAIFQWFADDFDAAGGVLPYLTPHLPEATRRWLAAHGGKAELAYFAYDWSLNALDDPS